MERTNVDILPAPAGENMDSSSQTSLLKRAWLLFDSVEASIAGGNFVASLRFNGRGGFSIRGYIQFYGDKGNRRSKEFELFVGGVGRYDGEQLPFALLIQKVIRALAQLETNAATETAAHV